MPKFKGLIFVYSGKKNEDLENSLRALQESNNSLIAALSNAKGTLIRGVVDSGAADHVGPKHVAELVIEEQGQNVVYSATSRRRSSHCGWAASSKPSCTGRTQRSRTSLWTNGCLM